MNADPALFGSRGIDLVYYQPVVVKSPKGFRAVSEPVAKAIFVADTPGVRMANLKTLLFQRVPRLIYSLDLDTPSPEGL